MKRANFHVLRESAMPAILTEGGFMDSTIDIIKLRDNHYLKSQGEAIADGLAEYFKLEPKTIPKDNPTQPPAEGEENLYKPTSQAIVNSTIAVLQQLENMGEGPISPLWREKLLNGTLTDSDAIGLLYVAIDRGLLKDVT
ncbi:MAG: N-acetylmuramoyl-L-alanine amidase [Sporosarcina sp.]